jgi:hypothetical protein
MHPRFSLCEFLLRLPAAALILSLCASIASAQSPCDGRITDKSNHPKTPGAVAKPAAGASYIDPVFKTKITRITNADPAEGEKAVIETLYNALRGWNADGSQIIAWHRAGARTYEFYEGDEPYAHLGQIVFGGTFSDFTGPADIEHIIWDSSDPKVLYYPAYDGKNGRGHPLLMKVTLNWPSRPTITIQRDFEKECASWGAQNRQLLSLGHGQDMSYDGKGKVGLRCGASGGVMSDFLYSITDDSIVGNFHFNVTDSLESPPWPCPSGNCSWRQKTATIYNRTMGVLGETKMANSLEHTSVGYTKAGGFDFVAQAAYDEAPAGSLMYWRLDQPNPTPQTLIGRGNGWPYPPSGTHPSLSAKDGSGWISIGNVGSGIGTAGVLDNEIVLANINTGTVCRVAHSRTCSGQCAGGNWKYWGETHPQISNDGYRILFNSDWENSNSVDMYVVDLRPGR